MDLSRWNVINSFTRREAAYLAVGHDPDVPSPFQDIVAKASWIEQMICESYQWTSQKLLGTVTSVTRKPHVEQNMSWHIDWDLSKSISNNLRTYAAIFTEYGIGEDARFFLPSIELAERFWAACLDRKSNVVTPSPDLWDKERFSRDSLAHWLKARNIEPIYQFSRADCKDFIPLTMSESSDSSAMPSSIEPAYSTDWLDIQEAAIKEFFNPRRNPDAKRNEVVEWIRQRAKDAGLLDSTNIARSIFTMIKPLDHNPRKKRAES